MAITRPLEATPVVQTLHETPPGVWVGGEMVEPYAKTVVNEATEEG
jgi:hypothetical protein